MLERIAKQNKLFFYKSYKVLDKMPCGTEMIARLLGSMISMINQLVFVYKHCLQGDVSRDGISVNRYIGSANISALFEILVIGIGKSQDR